MSVSSLEELLFTSEELQSLEAKSPASGDSSSNQMNLIQCLSHLGQMGIESVQRESHRIEQEKQHLTDLTRDLAFNNYKTFIQTANCSKEISQDFGGAQDRLDKLSSDKIPDFRESVQSFQTKADDLTSHRRLTSLVLARHTKLLEVLELPQLAETCVRNGHYEEALELQQFAAKLQRKNLGKDIPVVAEVLKAVNGSSKLMLNQLLSQLREPIQLPACLRIVGHLRRMNVFNETELRLRFLQARDSWLSGVLGAVPHDDPYVHLTKTMELTRVHLFDIVTQYRALFTDDDPLLVTAAAPYSSHRLLFSSWLSKRISEFLKVLELDLDRGAASQSLDSLLGQAMYFGQSLGRVGADFRLLLVPVFTKAIRKAAMTHLVGADQNFKNGMGKIAFRATATPTIDFIPREAHQPPHGLMEFIPMAELCNSILQSLNEVRLCAPLSLAPELVGTIQQILESVTACLVNQESKFNKSSTDTEKKSFQRLVTLYCREFLPFIDGCIRKVFPPESTATALSIAVGDLKTVLKTDPLTSPLKHLLPIRQIEEVVDEQEEVKEEEEAKTVYVADRKDEIEDAVKEVQEPNKEEIQLE